MIVEAPDSKRYVFKCNNWLDFKQGDRITERELYPTRAKRLKEIEYKLFVKTSDIKNAGTNANVYVTLFGSEGDTGSLL